MPFVHIPISHPAPIRPSPSNLLPVFLLVLQKDTLVLQVLSNFYDDLAAIVNLASYIETFHRISNIPDCVGLSLSILDWQLRFGVILIGRKQVYPPLAELIKQKLWSLVVFAKVL